MSRRLGVATLAVLMLLAGPAAVAGAKGDTELLGAAASTLKREPQLLPSILGSDPIEELRYADPHEGIDVPETPEGDSTGDAHVDLPMSIPPGRGGVQPDLTLSYDSGGDAGWLGTGWDLDVGAIEVDTTFGVPRYLHEDESESYVLDGDGLFPNAVRMDFVPRKGPRAEFTRRVDTEQELIIRHGTNPSNYWWEVRDKMGGIRWYGAHPDLGGPDGDRPPGEADDPDAAIDEGAVLRTRDGGPIYRWALSAQRDVGVNMMRFTYDKVEGERVGAEEKNRGTQLYLSKIHYTSASAASPGHPEDPGYEVRFLRDDDVDLEGEMGPRKDVVVDATGGFLQVTSDLLRRVEVWTGDSREEECLDGDDEDTDLDDPVCLRDFDRLAKAFDLHYREGAFGKALLTRVDQIGSDGEVFAHNDLDYFDDVRDDDGDYRGFEDQEDVEAHEDTALNELVDLFGFGPSALGSSEGNEGDVHAFLGFSPEGPSKTFAIGGSVSVSGGANQGVMELMDINGDGRPDKVFREAPGQIRFRLNESDASGMRFSEDTHEVDGLDNLSTDFGIGVDGGLEAYLGGSVQFNIGANVQVGEEYFEDVNNDGLPDFVSAGKVFFNHLEEDGDGDLIPTFERASTRTRAPIGVRDIDFPQVQELADLEAQQRVGSPLIDTVRRWVAPYAGVIDIDAPVRFDPQPDTRDPRPPSYDGDGVRVAIQKAGDELWAAELPDPGDSATPTGVSDLHVLKGQAVYFRQQSVDEGVLDQVRWDPTITYDSFDYDDDPNLLDVNRRLEHRYSASQDFTVAGRPANTIPAPFKGRIHYDLFLRKTKVLTDDVAIVLEKNGVDVVRHRIEDRTVLPDGLRITGDLDVTGPVTDAATGDRTTDLLTVKLEVDSDVDVSALEWRPRLHYVEATDERGGEVPVTDEDGDPTIQLPVMPYIDLYPTSSDISPNDGFEAADETPIKVTLVSSGALPGTRAVITVKNRDGLAGKHSLTIDSSAPDHITTDSFEFDTDDDERHWIEVDFRDASAMQTVKSIAVARPGSLEDVPLPFSARYAGPQDYFPLPYRGWGYAGYNGRDAAPTAPLDELAFTFRRQDFPDGRPTDFDRDGTQNPASGKAYPFVPHELQLKAQDGTVTGTADVWRGSKDTSVGGAGFSRSSRRGVDDPVIAEQPAALGEGGEANAPRRVGITAPSFGLTGGIGPISGSFGAAPSFGLVDYMDMNGDGFPDVVAPGSIEMTGPRGAYTGDGSETPQGVDCAFGGEVVGCDITFSVSGGFGGSGVGPKGDSRGQANTPQGAPSSSSKRKLTTGRTYSPDGFTGSTGSTWGFNLGASAGLEAEFTNPSAPDGDFTDAINKIGSLPELEADYADVNGDGLPDRIIGTGTGVRVQLNLGYGWTEDFLWAGGGFETSEAYSGNVGPTLGFQWNFKEFAGGLSYNEGVGMTRTTWLDVNGDGILDRLNKSLDDNTVEVAFGTGAGVGPDVDYGSWADGAVSLGGVGEIGIGEQIAQDQSRGFGGGVDFTVPIGPLCTPTPFCWILVNPGVHFDHSVNNTVTAVVDVDGDGAPDSVKSTDDDTLRVRRNRVGRTNLLRTVTSSVGQEIRLDYHREGNTTDQPQAQWALSSVQVDDHHRGDGADVQVSTFEYDDGIYDPLERAFLGFREVVEHERDFQGDGDASDDPVLRRTERTYRNRTVFESGLLDRETLTDPDGDALKESVSTWETVDLEDGQPVDAFGALDKQERLGVALSPRRTKLLHRWFDADGGVGQETWNEFRYDDLGNVVRQIDVGEPEDPHDDLVATTTQTDCDISMSQDFKDRLFARDGYDHCNDDSRADQVSPLWDPDRCPTWTSLPARYEVHDGDGRLLLSRDGSPALCDNSSVTRLEERTGEDDEVAVTRLDYDDWGSYNWIAYPGDHPPDLDPPEGSDEPAHTLAEDGERVAVHYVYDDHNHARVAETVDSHGAKATADYDPLTGRISERVDANGQKTSYDYDAAGRLASITGPLEQHEDASCDAGADHPRTICFEYRVGPGTSAAFARHFDAFDPDDPIETVAFADGVGREILTKRDATIHQGVSTAAADEMVVEDAVEFDALGRDIQRWYPTTEPLGQAHVFNGEHSTVAPTQTTWSLTDRVREIRHPNLTTTKFEYGYGGEEAVGSKVFSTTVTDQTGKPTRTYSDVRDNVLAFEERPAGEPVRRTRLSYDALGRLARAVEPGGGTTTHTYDLLGRRTTTRTPDAGLRERRFDVAGNLVAEVTPRMRAAGKQTTFSYDRERLTKIDYPDLDAGGTPDVSYEYGAAPAEGDPQPDGHVVARITRVRDGGRDQRLSYDPLGRIARDTALMLVPGAENTAESRARNTYTTRFTYDTYGRLGELTYPDGEVLEHGYDAGGLLRHVEGTKGPHTYRYLDEMQYDEFGQERLRTMGNGTRTVFGYDARTRWLARQVTDTPEREIQDLNYGYDEIGNVTKLDNLLPAPVTSLKGGPGWQAYQYDGFHRLRSAQGTYGLPKGVHRDYAFTNAYDLAGNVVSKTQSDAIVDARGVKTVMKPTTYATTSSFHPERVHQVVRSGIRTFKYDANGNSLGWDVDQGNAIRTLAWDAADDMRGADGMTYSYDDEGELAIEDGSRGTTAFVNDWYSVRNSTQATKYVFANDDRLLSKEVKADPADLEKVQRFAHTDLQGSVNVVTDERALVYQHSEYFPTGEVWVREDATNGKPGQQVSSDAFPYQYAGGYFGDAGQMTNFGQRWYDPRDGLFTAPDPLLADDPAQVADDPALLPAYTYAESNPLRLVDEQGTNVISAHRAYFSRVGALRKPIGPQVRAQAAQELAAAVAQAQADLAQRQAVAPAIGAVPQGAPAVPGAPAPAGQDGRSWARLKTFNERAGKIGARLDAYPLVELNFEKGADGWRLKKVGLSPTLGFWQKEYKPDKAVKRPRFRRKQAKAGAGKSP